MQLSNCGITDEGLLSLCIGLQSNSKIAFLDLSGNKITSNGFESLIECLDYNLPLMSLDIHNNDIEDFPIVEALAT